MFSFNPRSKLLHVIAIFLVLLFMGGVFSTQAAIRWQEDFDDPAIDGKGATGNTLDMDGVTKWDIDVSGASLTTSSDWEHYEGMYIEIPQTLYVTGHYGLGRDGEVILSVEDRLYTPTSITVPGSSALAYQEANDLSRILLDDGSQRMFPPVLPYLGVGNTLRAGDTLQGLS